MEMTSSVDSRTATITVRGDVDSEVAYRPYEEMVALADEGGVDTVVLDAAGVTFADSTALGMLVRMKQHAAEIGVRFQIRDASFQLRRLLDITALSGELDLI